MARTLVHAYSGMAYQLHEDKLFEKILKGQVRIPATEKSLLNAFPPALIPLWSTGARTIVGLWKHWFSSSRTPTFVEYYGATIYGKPNLVFERGRTFKQLIYWQLFKCISNRDGVDEEIQRIAIACGIDDVAAIDRLTIEFGDVSSLASHPEFRGCVPLAFFQDSQDGYTGDFPTRNVKTDQSKLEHCCVLEVHSGFKNLEPDYSVRMAVSENVSAPEWFRTSSQYELFQRFIDSKNLEAAWMSLNSPEWTLANARRAMTELASRSNSPEFSSLTNVWTNLPFPDDEAI